MAAVFLGKELLLVPVEASLTGKFATNGDLALDWDFSRAFLDHTEMPD